MSAPSSSTSFCESMLSQTFELAKIAVQTAVLVSGGGSVALLAFAGSMAGAGVSIPAQVGVALILMAAAVLAAGLATVGAYLMQRLNWERECGDKKPHRFIDGLFWTSFGLLLTSYAAFIVAAYFAYEGFANIDVGPQASVS